MIARISPCRAGQPLKLELRGPLPVGGGFDGLAFLEAELLAEGEGVGIGGVQSDRLVDVVERLVHPIQGQERRGARR